MKYKAVIEIITESYEEEQFILNRFPNSVWISPAGISNKKTLFYLPYQQYDEVKNTIEEWEKRNGD
jgi:hypothetical protein